MRKILFLASLLVFVLSSSVWAANVSGTWALKMTSPMGQEEAMDLVIKDADGNLTIETKHPMLGDMKGTGTLEGNAITMNIEATGQMPIAIEFTGTVTGNKMAGTREIKMSGGARGGAPGGGAPGGGAPGGGAPGGGAPGGGAPGGGAPGGAAGGGEPSNAWTAVKK